ncbi:MAG: DUF5684 domain-containing protein [Patescibacteria group bacterium]|nr:DUF5684 domain-containing protein [Patescibacteria group bacterium]
MVVVLAVAVFMIVCMWKIFVKAGKPGWAAIVPIYNVIVLLEIIGRPAWWVLFLFASVIPFVGWIAALAFGIIIALDLAKSFGKDTGFGILLPLLPIVGYPMLAFGKAEYKGPSASGSKPAAKTE